MVYIRCNNPEANKCRWLSAAPDGSMNSCFLSGLPDPWWPELVRRRKIHCIRLRFRHRSGPHPGFCFLTSKRIQELQLVSLPDKRFVEVSMDA